MPNKKWVAAYEGIFGLVGLGSLSLESVMLTVRGNYKPLEFWSYFTHLSNLIAAVALLASFLPTWRGEESRRLDHLRGLATLYMVITGAVYTLLVNNADPAVIYDHYIMHYLMPVVMFALWLYQRPAWRIPFKWAALWLTFPLAYAGYVQVYAHFTGFYLYKFLDPTDGVLPVVLTILVLLAASAMVVWGMVHLPLRRVTHRVM